MSGTRGGAFLRRPSELMGGKDEVAPDADSLKIVGDGVDYDGYRFRTKCKLAGKIYGARFGIDEAIGGAASGGVEEVTAEDLLGFAGIGPPRLRVLPIETHIAEKLHAYALERPNTRVKDLPDLALLATIRPLDAANVRAAFEMTLPLAASSASPRASPRHHPRRGPVRTPGWLS
jgi:hypothetical protein